MKTKRWRWGKVKAKMQYNKRSEDEGYGKVSAFSVRREERK